MSLWPIDIIEESARACDGTGCEFESWRFRINIVSRVHRAYDFLGSFGVSGYIRMAWYKKTAMWHQIWYRYWHLVPPDHAAIPDFSAGAMENWGLVLYRETALLHDEATSSLSNKYWVSLVMAHEIAYTVSSINRAWYAIQVYWHGLRAAGAGFRR